MKGGFDGTGSELPSSHTSHNYSSLLSLLFCVGPFLCGTFQFTFAKHPDIVSVLSPSCLHSCTVITAMLVFGDQLTTVNGLGLGIVICGVCFFNYHKYTKNKVSGKVWASKRRTKAMLFCTKIM
eukprot:1160317-Pelagomonas_calceolata.AAC.3